MCLHGLFTATFSFCAADVGFVQLVFALLKFVSVVSYELFALLVPLLGSSVVAVASYIVKAFEERVNH